MLKNIRFWQKVIWDKKYGLRIDHMIWPARTLPSKEKYTLFVKSNQDIRSHWSQRSQLNCEGTMYPFNPRKTKLF